MLRPLLTLRGSRLAANPGAAAYGAIVVTATVAAMSHHEERAWVVLVEAVAALLVFWLAHVHSAIIGRRFNDPDAPLGPAMRDAAAHELPMLEAASVPLAILALASIDLVLVDDALAISIALWAGVAELFAIGVLRSRRSRQGIGASLAMGALYAVTGGVLVALKAALH